MFLSMFLSISDILDRLARCPWGCLGGCLWVGVRVCGCVGCVFMWVCVHVGAADGELQHHLSYGNMKTGMIETAL